MGEPLSNRAWSVALVGRTHARAALRRWVTESTSGTFRLVAITGPAGIGKSRMLAWAAEQHRRRGGLVWLGRCSPELSPPFAPLMTAMGVHWPPPTGEPAEETLRLASSLDQPAPELHQVRAVADVVARASAARPVLLAVDDVHWADPGTLGLIEQLVYVLAAGGGRVMAILTSRPTSGDRAAAGVLNRVAREPAFRSLPLEPLDEVEVHELIHRLTGTSPDRRLVQRVHQASGGNPLVAIATADAPATGATRQPLGRTVDDVMARALEDLSPSARFVALALAVSDVPVSAADVEVICGAPGDACAQGLEELEDAELVVPTGDRWELVSPHLAEAVLEAATTRDRRAAHGRLAGLLRSRSQGDADLLAFTHHLELAGPRAAGELREVALDAAERAFVVGAWGWAARLYETGLEGVDRSDPTALASLEEKAGIACFRDFDSDRCEQHLTAAVALAEANGDHVLAARAAMWLARRRFTSGTEAIGRLIDVSSLQRILASRDVPADMRAQAHGLVAEIAFQANDLHLARRHAAEATSLAATAGDDFVGFWVATSDGLARLGTLELEDAVRAFQEADECLQRSRQDFVQAAAASRLAITEVLRGNLAVADQLAARASGDARHAANWSEHSLAETVQALVAVLRGRFDDHEDHGELAQVSCGRSSNTFSPLVLNPVVAWARAARGDREGASSALDALDAAGGRAARYRLALELMTDDPETVRKQLEEYDWRPYPPALTTYDAGAHAAQLELAIHAGNRAEAEAGCRLFEDFYGRTGRFVLEWPVLVPRLIAEAKVCLGHLDEALLWTEHAERVAIAAGARVELARLAVVKAGLLLASADDESVRGAVDLIDRATAEFDALGMLRFARLAQSLFDLPPPVDAATRRLRPRAVLFTDIVDSTAWNVRLGDEHWLVLMAEHNRVARREVRRQQGTVVKTTGDGICAWFPRATDAVECAESLQREFEHFGDAHPETPIRIRCGIAVGDVFDFDGDLAGLAVTEAARICAAAEAAQVVTSAEVRRLDDRAERRYRPLGPHDLKGLPEKLALFSVESWRDAADESDRQRPQGSGGGGGRPWA